MSDYGVELIERDVTYNKTSNTYCDYCYCSIHFRKISS